MKKKSKMMRVHVEFDRYARRKRRELQDRTGREVSIVDTTKFIKDMQTPRVVVKKKNKRKRYEIESIIGL